MKPKDIFSLAIRLLGLVFLYHGLQAIPAVVVAIITAESLRGIFFSVLMAGWQLGLALWLIRGAPLVLRQAYPDTSKVSEEARLIQQVLLRKLCSQYAA